jgi:hypothetical protein
MKYSSQHINSLSGHDYQELMIKELNENGYRIKMKSAGETKELKYYLDDDTFDKLFILGVDDISALNHLKEVGLINNNRCPMCGASCYGSTASFTSGYDSNMKFQICNDCAKIGSNTQDQLKPGGGCLLALFLVPFNLINQIIHHL